MQKSESNLVLRDSGTVALALIVSPLAGIAALWLIALVAQPSAIIRNLLLLPWMFMFGGPLAIVAELLVVVPLLLGFRRYRWRWLNGWSACAIGFALGSSPAFFLNLLGQSFSNRDVQWGETISATMLFGFAGFVAALVFRLLAVQSADITPSAI